MIFIKISRVFIENHEGQKSEILLVLPGKAKEKSATL